MPTIDVAGVRQNQRTEAIGIIAKAHGHYRSYPDACVPQRDCHRHDRCRAEYRRARSDRILGSDGVHAVRLWRRYLFFEQTDTSQDAGRAFLKRQAQRTAIETRRAHSRPSVLNSPRSSPGGLTAIRVLRGGCSRSPSRCSS